MQIANHSKCQIYKSKGQKEGQKEKGPETERERVRVVRTPVLYGGFVRKSTAMCGLLQEERECLSHTLLTSTSAPVSFPINDKIPELT